VEVPFGGEFGEAKARVASQCRRVGFWRDLFHKQNTREERKFTLFPA
jgi:hypothetical protein